ncbi:UDP-2-acetamido-2,6-beta-L-arabino-hexul-4-ose reductase [Rhodovulum sp. YNF3179]|uniref:UDP-2-acetamido-2,6-beta-L-arabino-hexul-4-ose reductase n=1 Tax=Rhodovulum sp. YNF3179 TaxID=3425127 RepID=UPI003D32C221
MSHSATRILVTGSQGFIGRNLLVRLGEMPNITVSRFDRGDDPATLSELIAKVDAIVHLAGENRPEDQRAFADVNVGLTAKLCDAIRGENERRGRQVALILASSAQAELETPYGLSKLAAEDAVRELAQDTGNPVVVFRFPGVFGKWCRPNYNSVVATFCHNIANGLPIRIDDPSKNLKLVYVDDVLDAVLSEILTCRDSGFRFAAVAPEYKTTLGDIAAQIEAFERGRKSLRIERVGAGLPRALYATFLSYLPKSRFAYDVPRHGDDRGVFVEMLKTPDSGQFSFLTADPGITRGGHYHHTKCEKFLVIKGEALFRFRHLVTDEIIEIRSRGSMPKVVETIPGWVHDVTNTGSEELIVMLWANEIFDRDRPDTIPSKV